jgi:hypothetical protein
MEEISTDDSISAHERLALLEKHLRERLLEARYLLP